MAKGKERKKNDGVWIAKRGVQNLEYLAYIPLADVTHHVCII